MTLKAYLAWLEAENRRAFDSDADLVALGASVGDDIALEANITGYAIKEHPIKEDFLRELIGRMNAKMMLYGLARGAVVFALATDACIFRWVKDNVADGAAVPWDEP